MKCFKYYKRDFKMKTNVKLKQAIGIKAVHQKKFWRLTSKN
jgi:hypothetical protein